MILPQYNEIKKADTESKIYRIIRFDKVLVRIYGDAKYLQREVSTRFWGPQEKEEEFVLENSRPFAEGGIN